MVKKLAARNEPRKGRGFGFVTLASEDMQKKAVDEMNGKQIEGREIAVKVAIDSPGKEDGAEGLEGAEHGENGTNGTTEAVAA
jgi:RNA recognition motif-containing protein